MRSLKKLLARKTSYIFLENILLIIILAAIVVVLSLKIISPI